MEEEPVVGSQGRTVGQTTVWNTRKVEMIEEEPVKGSNYNTAGKTLDWTTKEVVRLGEEPYFGSVAMTEGQTTVLTTKKVMKMIKRLSTNVLDLCASDGQRQPLGDLGGYY